MAKKKSTTQTLDIMKKVDGLDNLVTGADRPDFEFEFYEKEFKTITKVPVSVIVKMSILSDEDSSEVDQVKALVDGIACMLIKDDRPKFNKIIDEEDVDLGELFTVFTNLIQALSDNPLDTSSGTSSGSKKTKTSSMGTSLDELPQ